MDNETGTSSSKRQQVGITLIWVVLWTLILVILASYIIWNLLIYTAYGSAYAGIDLGEQLITQEGYNERIGWFQSVKTTALACIPLSVLIWSIELVLIIRHKRKLS